MVHLCSRPLLTLGLSGQRFEQWKGGCRCTWSTHKIRPRLLDRGRITTIKCQLFPRTFRLLCGSKHSNHLQHTTKAFRITPDHQTLTHVSTYSTKYYPDPPWPTPAASCIQGTGRAGATSEPVELQYPEAGLHPPRTIQTALRHFPVGHSSAQKESWVGSYLASGCQSRGGRLAFLSQPKPTISLLPSLKLVWMSDGGPTGWIRRNALGWRQ